MDAVVSKIPPRAVFPVLCFVAGAFFGRELLHIFMAYFFLFLPFVLIYLAGHRWYMHKRKL